MNWITTISPGVPTAAGESRGLGPPARTIGHRVLEALPPGWVPGPDATARSAPQPSGDDAAAAVDYVFLHPAVGVALIDLEPHAAPNAEARVRAQLAATYFHAVFPGRLPIVYRCVAVADIPRLGAVLRDALSALPPLDLPGGVAWMRRSAAP